MGLPSRAAFKIEEILARKRLVPKDARIVDLGCAPGGWLAILARTVGAGGRVVGVDLAPVRNPPAGAITIVGDILDASVAARVANELGGRADLVTSDLAPKLTGIAARDEALLRELIDAALASIASGETASFLACSIRARTSSGGGESASAASSSTRRIVVIESPSSRIVKLRS